MESQLKPQPESQTKPQSNSQSLTYQIMQYYKNSICEATDMGYKCSSAIINIILYPYAWAFLCLGAVSADFWSKMKIIASGACDLLYTIPLSYKILFAYFDCFLSYWCELKSSDEIKEKLEKKIHLDLYRFLNTLGFLPLSKNECEMLAYYFELSMNVAFTGTHLPYPDFFIYKPPVENGDSRKPTKGSENIGLPPADRNEQSSGPSGHFQQESEKNTISTHRNENFSENFLEQSEIPFQE